MVTDAFGVLLQEVGKLLKIPKMEPDKNNSCLIRLPDKSSFQLEIDSTQTFLMIGCDVGTLPAGRYRESVFREALKSNGSLPPRSGDFSYSKQADKLILSKKLPLKDLNGDKVVSALNPFLEKAKLWREAISRGDVPSAFESTYQGRGSSGMFGLK